MRRALLTLLIALAVIAGVGAVAVAAGHGSTVTRARLERSFPQVFANRYAAQAALLGHTGVTPDSLHARAMCDKHGPDVPDVGAGADWVCLVGWSDPNLALPPEGYGKFELTVHSNDCFTATGPSKLIGFLTLTDTHGDEVDNPVFEFDGCFDPAGDNSPTGVSFESLLTITSSQVGVDASGHSAVQLTCGPGAHGCAGTIAVTAGRTNLGSVPFDIKEAATQTVALPGAIPGHAKEVSLTFDLTTGFGPTSAATLSLRR